jgi:hypothetical protein
VAERHQAGYGLGHCKRATSAGVTKYLLVSKGTVDMATVDSADSY